MVCDVTIITAAYNSMPFVTTSVESLMEQTIGDDRLEFIAVDDCSTDGTGQELDRLAARWPRMRVIHLEQNSGTPARPRNVALDLAQGRYVFFLDADDYLGRETLERMVTMADEQHTDVVVGRMVGVGGRGVPQSMFTHTQPSTNVFESRAYWTFNPMKLFRRELIEELGLRFREDLIFGEDQPFTATMYLNAAGISILADYDYVYWMQRPDGQNMTSLVGLEGKLQCLDVMMPLIADAVPPGPKRNHLLQRHFELAIRDAATALALEPDRQTREAAYVKVKAWTDEFYSDEIGARLTPVHRVIFGLIARDRLDDLMEFYRLRESGEKRWPIVENGRTFAGLPFFRDPDVGLPDDYYDMTSRVRAHHFLERLDWNGPVLTITGLAHLVDLETSRLAIDVLVRHRETGIEYEIPAKVRSSRSGDEEGHTADDREPARFKCEIDVSATADGRALDDGIWDLRLRLHIDGMVKIVRFGSARSLEIGTDPTPRIACGTDGQPTVVSTYFTTDYGNLSLDVGEVWTEVGLEVDTVSWADDGTAAAVVVGRISALGVPEGSIRLRLEGADRTHAIAADLREDGGSTRFALRARFRTAAEGRPLDYGDWAMPNVRFDAGELRLAAPIPAEAELPTIRWWRGLRPSHARPLPDEDVLTIRLTPVNLKSAARRRLRGLRRRLARASR